MTNYVALKFCVDKLAAYNYCACNSIEIQKKKDAVA